MINKTHKIGKHTNNYEISTYSNMNLPENWKETLTKKPTCKVRPGCKIQLNMKKIQMSYES